MSTTTNWFETSLRIERPGTDGVIRPVNEKYLFAAESYTEAELLAIEDIGATTEGKYAIEDITRKKFADVVLTDDDKSICYYCATLEFITIDEKTAKEKKAVHRLLLQASDFHDAYARLEDFMRGSMMDYAIVSISRTKYIEVINNK